MRKLVSLIFLCSLLLLGSTSTPYLNHTGDEKINNVILMIGDGMGYQHVELGSWVEYGNASSLFMQQFHIGNVSTSPVNEEVTDSAASATAMATGYKTKNAYVGMLPNKTAVPTITEYSESNNKKTGLVTTSYFYHATPAAFSAHHDSRYEYKEIIPDMLDEDIDVIMGGGFHLDNLDAPEVTNYSNILDREGYTEIDYKENLTDLPDGKIIGTFGSGHLPYETNLDLDKDVRLHHMVDSTLDKLQQEDGFFLMTESARIDHAGHDENPVNGALEVIEFDRTIKMVHEWVQNHPDTLVIVTSDHETQGLDILSTSNLDDNLPSDISNETLARDRRIDRVNQISINYTADYHTDKNVPIYAFGAHASELFTQKSYDNTDIYTIIKDALNGNRISHSSTSSSLSSSLTSQTNSEPTSNPSFVTFLEPIFILSSVILIVLINRFSKNQ